MSVVAPEAVPLTWLYFKLYPGRLDLLDATVQGPVAALVERARPGVRRWFFLRYFDASGPHVRLRLRTSWDEADELALQHGALLDDLGAMDRRTARRSHSSRPESTGMAWAATARHEPDIRLDLYEPEVAKWGGTRGSTRRSGCSRCRATSRCACSKPSTARSHTDSGSVA